LKQAACPVPSEKPGFPDPAIVETAPTRHKFTIQFNTFQIFLLCVFRGAKIIALYSKFVGFLARRGREHESQRKRKETQRNKIEGIIENKNKN
jgi:hypothetical protein